jgi:hypothetical protein
MSKFLQIVVALLAFVLPGIATAQNPEHRIALVIGNAGYQAGALTTPANDAGLIAQTLQAAGFDVIGARDLDQDTLRRAFRDFVEKAQAAGPNTVSYVYLSGYGLHSLKAKTTSSQSMRVSHATPMCHWKQSGFPITRGRWPHST